MREASSTFFFCSAVVNTETTTDETMFNPRSPTRDKPSQVPTLPPLVAPWQHEETTPNRPHPKPNTSPCQPPAAPDKTAYTSSPSDIHHSYTELERQRKVSGATRRLEDLESRMAGLEQANLLRSLGRDQTHEDHGRERGKRGVELEMLLSEMSSHLKRLEERVFQNEQRILREEAQMTTLVQSTEETQRKVTEAQRELAAKSEEHEASLNGLRERLHQMEQRQLQLTNFSQEELVAQLRGVGEEMRTLKGRIETMSSSVGGKMNALDHRHSVLESGLQGVSGAVMELQRVSTGLKKQLDRGLLEVRTTLSEVESRLSDVGRGREKQDAQLRESFLGVQSKLERTAAHLRELFLGHLRENSAETAVQISQLRDEMLEAMTYGRQDCLRERESLKRELETRIAAIEEATEAGKRECEAHIKDLRSAVVAECDKIRSELTREIKATLQRGEEGRKVLQGAVTVVEEEAKVSRQELLSVLEAEIRTRSEAVEKIRAEQQRLNKALHRHGQSVKTSVEALEQRTKADREQVQLLQDSLVGQWQEIGVHLLADIDSRLSAVTTLSLHHPAPPTIPPPTSSQHHGSIQSPPQHLTPYLPVNERAPTQTQTPSVVGTPLSQASYLIEDDDDRGEEEGGRRVELTETQNQEKLGRSAGGASLSVQHQALATQRHGNPLHSKSRILPKLPHHKPGCAQDTTTNRHTGGGERKELFSVTEQAESDSEREASTSPTSQMGCEAVEDTVGREGEIRTKDTDPPTASDGTRHTAAKTGDSRDDKFGTTGSAVNSSTISSGEHANRSQSPVKVCSPTEPPVYDTSWQGTPSETELSAEKQRSLPSSEGEGQREGEEEEEKSYTSNEEPERESEAGSDEDTKVMWTIGEPHTTD